MTKLIIIISAVILYIVGIILTGKFIKKNSSFYAEIEDIGNDWISSLLILFMFPIICFCALINIIEMFLWPIFWIYYLGYWLFKKERPTIF